MYENSGVRGRAEASLDRLYREVILDHYRSPRNKRAVEGENAAAEGRNPLCGDEVRIALRLEEGRVVEAGFSGEGCALSMAAASMLAERAEGMDLESVRKLIDDFTRFLRGELTDAAEQEALADLTVFEGVAKFPIRVKCVLLPFKAFEEALDRAAAR